MVISPHFFHYDKTDLKAYNNMSLVDCASSQRQRHLLEFCQGEERFTGHGKAIITRQRKEEIIHFLKTGNLPVGQSNPRLTAWHWKSRFKLVHSAINEEGLEPLLAAASSSKQAGGGPHLGYLSFDELFPILYSCHDHHQRIPDRPESRCKRWKEMHALLREHYSNVSEAVLRFFVACCPLCRLEREAGVRHFTGDTVVSPLPKCIWTREQPFKEVHVFDQPKGRDGIIQGQRKLQVQRIACGPFHRSTTAGAGSPELGPCHQSLCTQEHLFLVEFARYSAFGDAAPEPELLTTEQLGRPAGGAGGTRPMLRAYLNGRTSNECSICGQQAMDLIGCTGCLRSLCLPCLCPCYEGRLRRLHVFTCHLCAGATLPGMSISDWFFPDPPDGGHQAPRPLRAKAAKHLAKRKAGTASLLAEFGHAPHAYPSLGKGAPNVVLLGDGSAAAQGIWGTVKSHVVDEGLILFRPTSGPEQWVWANFTSLAGCPLPCLPPAEAATPGHRPLSVFLENAGMVARPPFDHERLQLRWCTSTRSPIIVGGQAPLTLGGVVFVPRRKVGDEGDVGRTRKDHCEALDDGVSEATDRIGKLVCIGVRDLPRNRELVSEMQREEHVMSVGRAWDYLRSATGRVDTSSRLMLQLQWLSPARELKNDIARPRDEDGVLIGSPSCRKRVDRATLFDTGIRNWVCCGAARFENMPRLVTRADLMGAPGDKGGEEQGRPHFFVAAKHFKDRERDCWVLWDVCGEDTLSTQQVDRRGRNNAAPGRSGLPGKQQAEKRTLAEEEDDEASTACRKRKAVQIELKGEAVKCVQLCCISNGVVVACAEGHKIKHEPDCQETCCAKAEPVHATIFFNH